MVRHRGFTYTELLCVMAIALALWIMILPGAVRSRNRTDDTACASNLRNISWALAMYAQDHYGLFPPELTALTPRYLCEGEVYRCPRVLAAEKRFPREGRITPEGGTDYVYMPGLGHDDHPKEAVVWDRGPWHRHGGNVLYLSGAVAWVDEKQLRDLNTRLPSPREEGVSP